MRPLFAAVLITSLSLPVLAQHHDKVGWVSAEILQRPVTLREGVGKVNDPVTTESKEAQAFYNQGMAHMHSYVWLEAVRSFNQALRHDPKLAMAHLGLSRAYMNFGERKMAREALAKAQELSEGVTEREKMRIAIVAKQIEGWAKMGDKDAHATYKKFLDEAIQKFPSDPEIWASRGNAEEASIMGRGQRGKKDSIAFYEGALRVAPGHWGSNHYLIHSCEQINDMECALKHGKIYAEAAFAVPHAQHMYGHDLRRVGRTDEAITRFLQADTLEREYYKRENIARENDWHHAHNLSLLATSYQYQGRMKEAERLLLEAISIPGINDYQEFFKKDYAEFLINRKRYPEALEAAMKLAKGEYAMARAAGWALAGNAQLGMGKREDAEQSLKEAQKELADTYGMAKTYPAPYVDALEAELQVRAGEREKSFATFKRVIEEVRATPGPDAWMQAIYRIELVARIGREAGDWNLAKHATDQMLDHDQYYAGSQYALALLQLHEKNDKRAKELLAAARSFWRVADSDLPELEEIKKLIGNETVHANPALLHTPLELREMREFDPRTMV